MAHTETELQNPPVKVDIAYALISLSSTLVWSLLGSWLLYFYLPPEGEGVALVSAGLYSAVMFASRTFNALIALPMGYLSDHTRSRWGRRLPYMALSALPLLVFFVLLWTPPIRAPQTQSDLNSNLVYLAVLFVLYNVTYIANQIPYTALLPELALTDHHRVRVSAWSSGFFLLGMILSSLSSPLIGRLGYAGTALIYAGVCLPLFYLPLLVLRERPERQVDTAESLNFWEGLKAMGQNKAFLIMTATGFCYWGITTLVQSIIPYVVTEVCLLDVEETMWFYVPGILAALACYPLVTWLAGKVGKWTVFAGSLLASGLVLPGLMLIGDWIPLPLKAQGILWVTLEAVAISAVTMLPPAFGAEITDYDAELTGQRREGIYYAAWGVLDQVVNATAAAVLPLLLLLGRSHLDPRGPLGVRLVGVVGGVLMVVGFLIFLRYPLRGK